MITIRRAEKKDCKRLLELVNELAVYEKAPQEVTVTLQHFEESGFGSNPVWWGFVALLNPSEEKNIALPKTENNLITHNASAQSSSTSDGIIVGFALYYIRYSTWKGQCLYLEDFLVTEKARGKGIGKLLFDKVIEECKQKGFVRMCWQVLDWNEPAINFYKKYNANFDAEWLNGSLDFKPNF